MNTAEILVKRYTEAFLGYASESASLDDIVEQLRTLKVILRTNEEFMEFLSNPKISLVQKKEILDKILGTYFASEVRDLIKFLLEKERLELLLDICDYARKKYANGKTQEALLKTSYPLDMEIINRIKNTLEKRLNKKLHLYLELDPTLLGGVQIRVGNILIDGTVKGRLERLKEELMAIQI